MPGPLDYVPSPSIAPSRWPGLLASVGGEAGVREFMRTNPSDGGGSHWEGGFIFQPNDCLNNNDPVQDCVSVPFDSSVQSPEPVTVYPLYYHDSAICSTFGSDPDEVTRKAVDKLARSISYKLEFELLTGQGHSNLGLPDSMALQSNSNMLNGGTPTPAVTALGMLHHLWGQCSKGARAMLHMDARVADVLYHAQLIRKENGLVLDLFDNIIVAGSGYHAADFVIYATPVVNVRLGEVVVTDHIIDETTRVDIPNNTDRAIAYRAGAVYYDPCCLLSIRVDNTTLLVPSP